VKKKDLRSGYTTGACAAAAAKAAVMLLLGAEGKDLQTYELASLSSVEIPFPDGSRVKFSIHGSGVSGQDSAWASIKKDAGDDPDITNRAEIVAEARHVGARRTVPLQIKGGKGVGTVTKPGLSVAVGEPAINPVPRKMINDAVAETILESSRGTARSAPAFEITISVPNGEELAKKTLNARLGIIGGISILGTTGIVKPVSTEAWTATIASAMDVAVAIGHKEIVVSAGRTSEKAHMKKYGFSEEAYVLMGDYLEFSLKEAGRHGFEKIHLCAQWAKMVKIAMATPQTHVRFGAIDMKKASAFLNSLGIGIALDHDFNTAREMLDHIIAENAGTTHALYLQKVCEAAKRYAEEIVKGVPVDIHLVSYNGEIIAANE
jgi:cobalt-precorrin-5B (C1)-methyltransferase